MILRPYFITPSVLDLSDHLLRRRVRDAVNEVQ